MFDINLMPAQTVPTIGMPGCGHAVTTAPRVTLIEGTTASNAWSLVRDRHVVTDIKADMGLAQGYFPGTTAWRPPHC